MTLQPFTPTATIVAQRPDPIGAVGSIVAWAQNLSTAAQAIRLIVDTPFMPASFWPMPRGLSLREWPTPHLRHPRETEEEYDARREIAISSGAIAVVKGDEVGLTPQAALESIYVVRGKPGMYAETMEALVRAHGHQVMVEQLDERVCRMRSRRRGEEEWQRFEFSMARADKAGYSKQNAKYRDDPQTMLHARCRAIAARGTAPEVLKGLRSVEEIQDEAGADVQVTAATRTVKPRQARAITPPPAAVQAPAQAASAPAGDDLLDYDQPAAATATVEPITEPQLRKLGAVFADLGVTGPGSRTDRLTVASRIVGRPLESSKDLTKTEARTLIDTLEADGAKVVAEILQPDDSEPAADDGDELLGDDFDPTTEQDWPMDGAQAAAEGGIG